MRFLRFLCNFLMFFAVAMCLSIVQVLTFDLVATQSEDIEGIHISAAEKEDIAYFDSYAFWAEDIGANFKQGPKYRIRNAFSWAWWKKGMAWADYGLDAVIASVKPIIVPIAQINAIKNFHGYTVNDFEKYLIADYSEDYAKLNNSLYELYIVFGEGYGEAYIVGDEEHRNISEYEYTGEYNTGDFDKKVEYARWAKNNKKLYNYNWKLSKYNDPRYEKYFDKFISCEPTTNIRHIKTAAVVMYYQQFVSLVISFVFVLKYPITFVQGRVVGRRHKGKEEVVGH